MDGYDDATARGAGKDRAVPPPSGAPSERAGAEQVEDYLRLDEHIAALQADRRPPNAAGVPAEQLDVYRMAALFRAAAPGAADPDPEFAARLWQRLRREADGTAGGSGGAGPAGGGGLSRRGLLAGGLGAAAAAAAGVAAGVGFDRMVAPRSTARQQGPLVPNGVWAAVARVDAIPVGGVARFATEHVVGFVRHTADGFVALSGACTHMGCLVAWNAAARTFDCPCHGGRFLEDGRPAPSSPLAYSPLPAIKTKVADGQVWVYVPPSGAPAPSAGDSTPNSGAPGYPKGAAPPWE